VRDKISEEESSVFKNLLEKSTVCFDSLYTNKCDCKFLSLDDEGQRDIILMIINKILFDYETIYEEYLNNFDRILHTYYTYY
jgi:hypothetical protein